MSLVGITIVVSSRNICLDLNLLLVIGIWWSYLLTSSVGLPVMTTMLIALVSSPFVPLTRRRSTCVLGAHLQRAQREGNSAAYLPPALCCCHTRADDGPPPLQASLGVRFGPPPAYGQPPPGAQQCPAHQPYAPPSAAFAFPQQPQPAAFSFQPAHQQHQPQQVRRRVPL